MTRRLAALLAADIAGYSRLMHEDEEATHARFTEIMRGVVDPAIGQHAGRIVKNTGDGFLAEFGSAVEAVGCALQFQDDIAAITADATDESPLEFRVGIHLGEVIVEQRDIFGDGVNIAARINGLAEPGGIMLSDAVHENVRGRLPCEFEDLGVQQVKNIARPLHLFRAVPAARQRAPARAAATARPSIVVLPFQSLGGDAAQDSLALGIVEDLSTALSRFRALLVLACGPGPVFRGRDIDVRQVGRELGARYVVLGSLRRIGEDLRISCQAMHADTAAQLWAERYDCDLTGTFAAQDAIVASIVGGLAPALERAEIERARCKPVQGHDAYDLYLHALAAHRMATRQDNEDARAWLNQALALDAYFVPALVLADTSVAVAVANGWLPPEALGSALRHARLAAELAPDDADALAALARRTAMVTGDVEQAIVLAERAAAANPLSPAVWRCCGYAFLYAGRGEQALQAFQRARQLAAEDELGGIGVAYALLDLGRDAEAMDAARRAAHHDPASVGAYRVLAAGLALAGRDDDAAAAVRRLLELDPACCIAAVGRGFGMAGAGGARLMAGLRRAGIAETSAPASRRGAAGEAAGAMGALRGLPEPRRMLLVSQLDVPRRDVPIGPAPLLIGRAPDCDLVLSDHRVSRAHCRIVLADDAVTATDLNSTNGTLLDGQPITRTTTLPPGAVLQIGACRLEYRCEELADPEATIAGRPRPGVTGMQRRQGSPA